MKTTTTEPLSDAQLKVMLDRSSLKVMLNALRMYAEHCGDEAREGNAAAESEADIANALERLVAGALAK